MPLPPAQFHRYGQARRRCCSCCCRRILPARGLLCHGSSNPVHKRPCLQTCTVLGPADVGWLWGPGHWQRPTPWTMVHGPWSVLVGFFALSVISVSLLLLLTLFSIAPIAAGLNVTRHFGMGYKYIAGVAVVVLLNVHGICRDIGWLGGALFCR